MYCESDFEVILKYNEKHNRIIGIIETQYSTPMM